MHRQIVVWQLVALIDVFYVIGYFIYRKTMVVRVPRLSE